MINPLIQFSQFADERGILVAVHGEKDIPFVIKRVYYIYSIDPSVCRGHHAHKKSQQILICLKGQCSVVLDDAQHRQNYLLNDPIQGLFIDQSVWLEMHHFSPDCLLMVLSSTSYDPDEYINDYQDFLKHRQVRVQND